MFKKNVYAISAILTLSCSAYAMEGRDDLSSSETNAPRSSSASWHAPEPETAIEEDAFEPFPKDTFPTPFPIEFDFSADSEGFSPKITASPASSTQSSLSNAEIAAQEEIEKQLTSRLTELEDELKASKAEAAVLRTSLEEERAVRLFKERCQSRK